MITLQFVTERWSLASAFIRYANWIDVSHVDLVLPSGELLGARTDHNPGVQIRPAGYANFSRIVQIDFDFTPAQTEAYLAWIKTQIGKPYDSTGIEEFFIHSRRNWRDPIAWFCSELQARASEIAGNPLLDFSYVGCFKIDPRDLLLIPRPRKLATRYLR